ncbi:MAG: electron transfer flavoprotein subunit beta/FixA family protein [Chloroflexi bacterium]|nr:electron transfer flavoprotein subunit beta/FixA family protein [Chloroflexota bacterium]
MNIVVFIKLVPDLVEELDIDDSGTDLDRDWLRLLINEFDDHAMEQAILLKERGGAQVTVIAPEVEGVDDVIFTASARGADRLIKLTGDFEEGVNNHALARALADVVKKLQPDLVLTGVQANDDLDGAVGPLLAEYLGFPYVGYISGVKVSNGACTARKEYPGGLMAEMETILPAVLGIQAAEEPPRYVAISKVRQAMKTAVITDHPIPDLDPTGGPAVSRMFQPEAAERAAMIEGDEEEVAVKLIKLFQEMGVLS